MIITPITGNPVRHNYFGINFELNPPSSCNEAWLARLSKLQKEVTDFSSLPDKDRAELNARALVGTVITNHDTFSDTDGNKWSYLGASNDTKYANQTEELLIKDSALRAWVYETFNDVSSFEDKERSEVVKKY